ncbi:MAG: HD-GYP domain-containing protein [Spirochaetaceae bacterium]|jgi:HD-GYP domain-containing protein (c-di-GMP phosphodiesterase class II)|nr:HD-GYP domain-containing protein [Spirochaetaceae bacterium]
MKTFDINLIPAGHFFSKPVYIDDEFVLVSQEMEFTVELKKILIEWRFDSVKSNGEPQEMYREDDSDSKNREKLFRNDSVKLAEAKMYYLNFRQFARDVFVRAANKNNINYDTIGEKMREVCDKVKTDRRFLLQVQKDIRADNDEDFLAVHAVKSTIVSIVIGIYLKLPAHRLIELGVAALLHEIGMVKLPSRITQSKTELSSKDRATLMLHPSIGFEMLKSFGFSMAVCAAALEHHERENGSGYPHKLTGDKTGLYGKIVAVACSYEAITSKRPHKDARGGYEGVTDLLRNKGNCYDDAIVRALVFSLSIYPIGEPVMLSNGVKGTVVDINPSDPRYPVVQLLDENRSDGQVRIIETRSSGIHITGPLTDNI